MRTLTRGFLGGLLVFGLCVLGTPTSDLAAQAKKDDKKAPAAKKVADDPSDRSVAFGTSDGLSLNGYFYQGAGLEKQRPDAVLMFPAPGQKVTDAWIDLAKKLSQKNYSVLLFDWRGVGRNGPEAGTRVFENPDLFWREPYNLRLLKGIKGTVDDKGLDWRTIAGRQDNNLRYRDVLLTDLMAARFFLDKKSDEGRCNTNRVWVISEKDGAHLGLAFIAAEFYRNSIHNPNPEPFKSVQLKSAGKDYVGLVALSYSHTNPTASRLFSAAVADREAAREIRGHLESRLATVLVHTKKEGSSASKGLVSLLRGGSTEAQMRTNFKYLREVDAANKPISGIGMIDSADTYKVGDLIQDALVGVTKAQPFGRDTTDREANKMSYTPRFAFEFFLQRR
jgi:hypothetical protein